MKVKLVGIQPINFTNDGGEVIKGTKLHVVSLYSESTESMHGRVAATVFTKLDVSSLKLDGIIDLVYEQRLGSKKSLLVAVEPVAVPASSK